MKKGLHTVIAQPSSVPAVNAGQAIEQTVLQSMVVFDSRTIFHDTHAESTRSQKLRQGGTRVVVEMMWQR